MSLSSTLSTAKSLIQSHKFSSARDIYESVLKEFNNAPIITYKVAMSADAFSDADVLRVREFLVRMHDDTGAESLNVLLSRTCQNLAIVTLLMSQNRDVLDAYRHFTRSLEYNPLNMKVRERLVKMEGPKGSNLRTHDNVQWAYGDALEWLRKVQHATQSSVSEESNRVANTIASLSEELTQSYHKFRQSSKYKHTDVFYDLIPIILSHSQRLFLRTKKQLSKVENRSHHEVWHMVDFFDPRGESSKYVDCPPELFAWPWQVESNTSLSQRCADLGQHRYLDNSQQTREEHEDSLRKHDMFALGEKMPYGAVNIALVVTILSRFLKSKRKDVPPTRALYWRGRKILNVGLVRVLFRGASISNFGIGSGGVVRRSYDEHFWIALRVQQCAAFPRPQDDDCMEDTDGEHNSKEAAEIIYVDFMGTLYDIVTTHPTVSHPYSEMTEQEASRNTLFKIKKESTLFDDAALNYIQSEYFEEFKDHGSRELLKKLIGATEQEFEAKGLLKAFKLF